MLLGGTDMRALVFGVVSRVMLEGGRLDNSL